ncbi:multidrug efflux SMR transporter [Maricaulis sp.]|uniref:DMT family transporter n=1 Tax=Maricaulis sp. TaxID=1486257 RepID=UPI0032994714
MNLSLFGPWTLLVLGGILEMVWALGFKYVGRDAPWWQQGGVVLALIGSMTLLFLAMKQLPAGTAYAVWTGIGALGVATLGILVFKEPATLARIVFLALILIGIIGLKATSGSSAG